MAGALARGRERLCAPELLDVEVLHVLRRHQRAGEISESRASSAVIDIAELPLARYTHVPLARMWELLANLTGHDAAYLARRRSIASGSVCRVGVRLGQT